MRIFVLVLALFMTGCSTVSARDVQDDIVETQRILRQIARLDTLPDISVLTTIGKIQKEKAKQEKK